MEDGESSASVSGGSVRAIADRGDGGEAEKASAPKAPVELVRVKKQLYTERLHEVTAS